MPALLQFVIGVVLLAVAALLVVYWFLEEWAIVWEAEQKIAEHSGLRRKPKPWYVKAYFALLGGK